MWGAVAMHRLALGFGVVSALAATTQPAYAYLDPGTASILLQGIIGGIAAGLAVVSLYYHRLRAKVASWFKGTR